MHRRRSMSTDGKQPDVSDVPAADSGARVPDSGTSPTFDAAPGARPTSGTDGGGGSGATSRGEPADAADGGSRGPDRRSFLRLTGAGAGLAATGGLGGLLAGCESPDPRSGIRRGAGPDVVVVGAGAFGIWTALHLQEMGARVTVVDLYGPGNVRSTSGDETRGVRTSYPGREQWTSWAQRAILRWQQFDEEHAATMGPPVFYNTGDLICRDTEEGFITEVKEIWDTVGIAYDEISPEEAAYRWPGIDLTGITHCLYEPGAGVVRARATCQRVAALFQQRGGEIRLGRAELGNRSAGRMLDVQVNGERLPADRFVFALGPWFATTFQDVMADKIRIPIGNVVYYGPPAGDLRFQYPNMPSWNFPGVTGWPCLPPDNRGFRVRTGGRAGEDPDTSDRWVPPEQLDRPRQVVVERFPDLADAPVVQTHSCHYESSATRDWIIDHYPGLENVWLAGGGSAEGFKFGPVVGELIASRALETNQFPELADNFRLDAVPDVERG
ncbi:MAG: FAD-binding oxidoreductase [Gemmatimonadota bacterium]